MENKKEERGLGEKIGDWLFKWSIEIVFWGIMILIVGAIGVRAFVGQAGGNNNIIMVGIGKAYGGVGSIGQWIDDMIETPKEKEEREAEEKRIAEEKAVAEEEAVNQRKVKEFIMGEIDHATDGCSFSIRKLLSVFVGSIKTDVRKIDEDVYEITYSGKYVMGPNIPSNLASDGEITYEVNLKEQEFKRTSGDDVAEACKMFTIMGY